MESSYRAVATDSGIFIVHDGVKGKSGRYPYGSGEEPYQRLKRGGFLSWGDQKRTMKKLRKQSYKRKKLEQKRAQQQVTTQKKKSYNEMTNEELKSAIERLTLQKQFKDLDSYVNPAKQSLGKKFLKEAKESIAKETVKGISGLAAPTTNWLGGKAINNLFNDYIIDVDKYKREAEERAYQRTKDAREERRRAEEAQEKKQQRRDELRKQELQTEEARAKLRYIEYEKWLKEQEKEEKKRK